MDYIYDLREKMTKNSVLLAYEGEFSQDVTKSVLSTAERNMDASGESLQTKRKVFNVMVECLQNIVKHNSALEDESAIFLIGKDNLKYLIATGNEIDHEIKPKIKAKIDKINSLDKDGLKKLYRDIIKGNRISERGGAGLGFVDMARKSGNKLEYNFYDISNTRTFFVLRVLINKNKKHGII